MNHLEIRKNFLKFFEKNNHTYLKSASLVPQNDSSLLFVNAGMNPFKNIFLGLESTNHKSIASIQKCMRAGGKHNDLEQVGPSSYHHTFFEMMGNFSFGDYFKEEACFLAWDFLTKKLNIPKENLAVSVFKEDKETAEIWNKKINIPKEKIFLFGEEDNFWRMGDSGPCGPCSEIYFDSLAFRSGPKSMVEVWNLVFMEYNENSDKTRSPLQTKCIDTGMGLERLAMILQNKKSNYHTDLFLPILSAVSQATKTPYREEGSKKELALNSSLRAIADHIRAGVFLIGEGVYPSNEKRAYVLRRILRRVLYLASTLNSQKLALKNIAEVVIENYAEAYPELLSQKENILGSLKTEEEKFFHTLEQGKAILEKTIFDLKKQNEKTLPEDIAFKLYDTYGFPFDLTGLVCRKNNINVSERGFEKKIKKAQEKSRSSSHFKKTRFTSALYDEKTSFPKGFDPQKEGLFFIPSHIPLSKFTGYETLQNLCVLSALFDKDNKSINEVSSQNEVTAVFNQTPFYAEGGGQVGDQGFLSENSSVRADILDCQNRHGYYFHKIFLKEGSLKIGKTYTLKVSKEHREQTALHHSATHLLHSALRNILGPQIRQAGSLVERKRLRFDFTSSRALTERELVQIEDLVNKQILQALEVQSSYKNYDKALEDGFLSFFEKPSADEVRVLKIGEFSKELCGGTHVQNTKDILFFKIISESSLSSGVRRIEAFCGKKALDYLLDLSRENLKIRKVLSLPSYPVKSENLLLIVKKLKEEKKTKKETSFDISTLDLTETFTLNSKKGVFYCAVHPQADHEFLSTVSDQIKKKFPLAVVVVMGENSSTNIPIVASLPKEMSGTIKAQNIIKHLGGKGGGPPHFAKGALAKALSKKVLRQKVLTLFRKEGFLKDLK